MTSRTLSRLASLVLLLSACGMTAAHAGGESALDYARSFLLRYPAFTAEGVMTSTLSGNRAPYRCRVEIIFQKGAFANFFYNTNAVKNIIPYDYNYGDRKLWETVYNRERTEVLSRKEVGAPTRTLFNFVWDLLKEAEAGAGFRSLVFNGLMSLEQTDAGGRTRIMLARRFPIIPVERVLFTFDSEQHLRSLQIFQADGSQHRIEIRRFRVLPAEQPVKNPAIS